VTRSWARRFDRRAGGGSDRSARVSTIARGDPRSPPRVSTSTPVVTPFAAPVVPIITPVVTPIGARPVVRSPADKTILPPCCRPRAQPIRESFAEPV